MCVCETHGEGGAVGGALLGGGHCDTWAYEIKKRVFCFCFFFNKGFISGCPIREIFFIPVKMETVDLPFCQAFVCVARG